MSEWGNPDWGMPVQPMVKKIAIERGTQGTETSQYLEEKRRFRK
jgi:hypothetical protein